MAAFGLEPDAYAFLAARESVRDRIVALDELAGVLALEALRGNARAIHLDVKEAVAARVPPRAKAIGNRVRELVGQPVSAFVLVDAEPDDVGGPRPPAYETSCLEARASPLCACIKEQALR